jgi:hypothetical protein
MITDTPDVDPAEFERVTGWALKAEGACREDVCVPLAGRTLAELAKRLRMPLVRDEAEGLWCLGPAVAPIFDAGGKAPDLELPDIAGNSHRLGDQRGRKVLILAWAPW